MKREIVYFPTAWNGRLWAVVALVVLSFSIWVLYGSSPQNGTTAGDWSIFLPEADGKDLVVKSCFNCHDLARVVTLRGDWIRW
jgi:hypothetical protein